MKDLEIVLDDRPGALAAMGAALAAAGVSIEGGGVWSVAGEAVAHYLFEDSAAARGALERAGFAVRRESDVVILRLDQETPGQLGTFAARLAAAGVNIEAQYSDHDHRLILVVDQPGLGHAIAGQWMRERGWKPEGAADTD